jgi:aminoacyl tRNA synthase complex-interacting multifunctional protein 1
MRRLRGVSPPIDTHTLTFIVFPYHETRTQARKLAGIPSHGMILAASDDSHERVELLVAPEGAVIGERVRFGESDEPQAEPQTPNQLQKKKTWEELQPLLVTDDACVATYKGVPMMTSAGAVKCATLTKANIG